MKTTLAYITFLAALTSCTAGIIPDKPEKASIIVELPETKALINDTGAGSASFSWENGDEIGVVVDGKYYRFTLSGKNGGQTGTFTADLPSGISIEDGATVAFPYIAEDYNESTGVFSLTYPTEYTSTKDGDFRHRWAGTLSKDGSGKYHALLSHQTAILRVTYDNVPAEATAVLLTADQNLAGESKSITTTFSWHQKTMNFYFPVPAGTYHSFSLMLLNGNNEIDGTTKTLSGSDMILETGKIYRTPIADRGPKKILVAYFSFTNNTKAIAESMAGVLGADLYQITPDEAYTSENNNYYDSSTRAYQEQYGPASARPAIKTTLANTDYDIVFLGFPIWYGKVPRVILTFLDTYNFSGKTVVPFCTSGSSGINASHTELQNTFSTIKWKSGARLNGYSAEQLKSWLAGFGIKNTPIRISVGNTVFSAELANNATAKEFDALLPMTLDMTELNGNEKYKYLDTTLPSNASCPGTINAGDVLLYGNNCVVVFYKTFNTTYSYTKIGRIIDSAALASALGSGNVSVQFGH